MEQHRSHSDTIYNSIPNGNIIFYLFSYPSKINEIATAGKKIHNPRTNTVDKQKPSTLNQGHTNENNSSFAKFRMRILINLSPQIESTETLPRINMQMQHQI
ncbi:hypothetical protein AAHE18_03G257600 [Arachis hypogaea]